MGVVLTLLSWRGAIRCHLGEGRWGQLEFVQRVVDPRSDRSAASSLQTGGAERAPRLGRAPAARLSVRHMTTSRTVLLPTRGATCPGGNSVARRLHVERD